MGMEVTKPVFNLKKRIYTFLLFLLTFSCLQPLDVGIFAPLKTLTRDAFKLWLEKNPGVSFKRQNFPALVRGPWVAAQNTESIRSAFAKCGIWPLDATLMTKINTHYSDSLHKELDPTFTSLDSWFKAYPEDEKICGNLEKRLNLSPRRKRKAIQNSEDNVNDILYFPVRSPTMATKLRSKNESRSFARLLNAPERLEKLKEQQFKKEQQEKVKAFHREERELKQLHKQEEEEEKIKEKLFKLDYERPLKS
eukprot:Pompholyxophrys_sp_v1_NODE_72_length_2434_cov_5.681379.p1 type:complete len:251 gc:universal NODE_72_length_2434_cov_5.681379:1474-2226(+)